MPDLQRLVLLSQIIGCLLLMLFVSQLPAIEQFNQRQCQQLSNELQKNRDKQRSGYTINQSDSIKGREEELQQQLKYHCAKPVKGQANASTQRTRPTITNPNNSLRHASYPTFIASLIELKAPYQGAQLQAWLQYYQEPKACYNVRATAQIVYCANLRQAAQRQFELDWHNRQLSDQY